MLFSEYSFSHICNNKGKPGEEYFLFILLSPPKMQNHSMKKPSCF